MKPGDKVRLIGPAKDPLYVTGAREGTIKRIEVGVTGAAVYIVNTVVGDLWTDHGRVEDNEERWSADQCEPADG